jgi:N-acylneuraminate cytidylyltransferase
MKTIAFIFARGGSKGLPRKNILPLNGKPLLGYSIDIAKNIREVSEIFVSTDDKDIARIAEQFKAHVILRPKHLAQDDSPEWLSWKHAVDYLNQNNYKFDKFLSLPTTAPLRNTSDVQACLDLLDTDSNTDVVVTIKESHQNPFFNMVTIQQDGYVKLLSVDGRTYSRRQDPPKIYDMTTVAYVSTPEFILSADSLFEGRVKAVNIPRERAIDIDTEIDFMIADTIIKRDNSSND